VANVVLLAAFGKAVEASAADFAVLRLLEDWHYQSVVRQLLKKYELMLALQEHEFSFVICSGTSKSSPPAIHRAWTTATCSFTKNL
jgi:hypothetical protein